MKWFGLVTTVTAGSESLYLRS